MFTDVSSCAAAVPSPIMATCHGLSRGAGRPAHGEDRVGVEGTLKPRTASRRCEGDRAVGIDLAPQPPDRGQHVQMGEQFAKSLARIGVQHPREYFLRDRKGGGLAGNNGRHVVEPGQMVLAQLGKPRDAARETAGRATAAPAYPAAAPRAASANPDIPSSGWPPAAPTARSPMASCATGSGRPRSGFCRSRNRTARVRPNARPP